MRLARLEEHHPRCAHGNDQDTEVKNGGRLFERSSHEHGDECVDDWSQSENKGHHIDGFPFELKSENDSKCPDSAENTCRERPDETCGGPISLFPFRLQNADREKNGDNEVCDTDTDQWPQRAWHAIGTHRVLALVEDGAVNAPTKKREGHKG